MRCKASGVGSVPYILLTFSTRAFTELRGALHSIFTFLSAPSGSFMEQDEWSVGVMTVWIDDLTRPVFVTPMPSTICRVAIYKLPTLQFKSLPLPKSSRHLSNIVFSFRFFFFMTCFLFSFSYLSTCGVKITSPIALANLLLINLVSILRCSSPSRNPVTVRHVDPSPLVFSLSSHRHSYLRWDHGNSPPNSPGIRETGMVMPCCPPIDLLWVQITQSYPNRLRFWTLPCPESPCQ
jgi:hypothetical protein